MTDPKEHDMAPDRRAGRATPEGTQRYVDEVQMRGVAVVPGAYRPLGRTGLNVAKIGYGGYRVHADVEEHVQTLLSALIHGCNLIDTSTNYTDGGSERLIGNVLKVLCDSDGLQRENVVVVSKVGYVQGSNYELALERDSAGDAFPEMVKYQSGLWHCIHPRWLEDQLERSLERLQLSQLDMLLLHNPEYYFTSAKAHGGDPDLGQLRAVFYARVSEAFEQMERFVVEHRISWYGISSNTFGDPAEDWEHVSLSSVLECARQAAKTVHGDPERHHFAVAQVPLNLYEADAFAEENSPEGTSFLEMAVAADVAVLANRPLNAIVGTGLIRLAQYAYSNEVTDPALSIADVEAAEEEIVRRLKSVEEWSRLKESSPTRLFFDVGQAVRGVFPDLTGREQWLQAYEHFIGPSIAAFVRHVDEELPEEHREEWAELKDVYERAHQSLSTALTSHFNRRETADKAPLRDALNVELGAEVENLSLSQIALNAVASVPGVTTALCGMKRESYVHECVKLLGVPAFDDPYAAFRAPAKVSLTQ